MLTAEKNVPRGRDLRCNRKLAHSRFRCRFTTRNCSAKQPSRFLACQCNIPDRMRYPCGATLVCNISASSIMVSAVRLPRTTVKVRLILLSCRPLKMTLSPTPFKRKFSRATLIAMGSLSMAQISVAPRSRATMARIPEPVPTSSTLHFFAVILPTTTSRNSIQLRVVA